MLTGYFGERRCEIGLNVHCFIGYGSHQSKDNNNFIHYEFIHASLPIKSKQRVSPGHDGPRSGKMITLSPDGDMHD